MGAQRRARPASAGRGRGRAAPGRAGAPVGPGSMGAEARRSGLDPREAPILSTFTPETAAALPGRPLAAAAPVAAAEAFASSPLPTEKDEVWRYSRIDQLDLDRFRPAGADGRAADDPGPSPSDRVHALVDGLGPRSGLMVTIDGVLATVASSVGDDCCRSAGPPTTPRAPSLLGSVLADPHDFVLLNDAFAVDPLVVDVPAGAVIDDPVVVVHVVSGADGRRPSSPGRSSGAAPASTAGVIEIVVDADAGLLADPADRPAVVRPRRRRSHGWWCR